MRDIVIGDKVAYSVQFLRSIGESHSDMAHARGRATRVWTLGVDTRMVTVEWDHDMPEHVNAANLALVGLNRRFSNVD